MSAGHGNSGTAHALLNRRTRNRAVGAIDAAVARFGLQHRPAALAVIEVLAGVGRHPFGFGVTAPRACDHTDDNQGHWARSKSGGLAMQAIRGARRSGSLHACQIVAEGAHGRLRGARPRASSCGLASCFWRKSTKARALALAWRPDGKTAHRSIDGSVHSSRTDLTTP